MAGNSIKSGYISRMCNALSPEKAVIWSALHGLVSGQFKSEYFRHSVYRGWFEAAGRLHGAGLTVDFTGLARELDGLGFAQKDTDKRALKRLLRVSPPARVRDNVAVFSKALADIHRGQPVHLEYLIN